VLAAFTIRRKEVPFGVMFWSFALFILSCGIGHLVEASIFWHPWYRLSGTVKVVTAVVSWTTVVGLIAVLPKALAMPRLAGLSERLMQEIAERTRIEHQYRSLYENSPSYYVTLDLRSGQISLCNRNFSEALGYSREELIGRRFDEMATPECVPLVRQCLAELRSGQDVGNREISLKARGADAVVVLFSGHHLAGENSAACALRNITDRKRVELALKDSEQRFQAVIEHAPSAILLTDNAGRIVLSNQKAVDYFGLSREELSRRALESLFRFRDPARLDGPRLSSLMNRDLTSERSLRGVRADGSEFAVELGLNPISVGGQPHVIASIQDMTERQLFTDRLESTAAELRQINHDLEEIAYAASHDLQEPLRAVAGYCQLLKLEHADSLNTEAREYLDKAISGTKRMHSLIHGLLAFSRVQRLGNEFDRVEMRSVVQEALENLEVLIQEARADVSVGELPVVAGDRSQLVQLMQNLVGNAIKYRREEKPRIRISAERLEDEWRFTVEDNGIGIPVQFRDKIFLIFQRLHNRADYDGTGIGLAICKQIIERHQGTIWVEGEEGRGSRFLFTLPDASQLARWRRLQEQRLPPG
jgi:PAS domain S-box-containing protein